MHQMYHRFQSVHQTRPVAFDQHAYENWNKNMVKCKYEREEVEEKSTQKQIISKHFSFSVAFQAGVYAYQVHMHVHVCVYKRIDCTAFTNSLSLVSSSRVRHRYGQANFLYTHWFWCALFIHTHLRSRCVVNAMLYDCDYSKIKIVNLLRSYGGRNEDDSPNGKCSMVFCYGCCLHVQLVFLRYFFISLLPFPVHANQSDSVQRHHVQRQKKVDEEERKPATKIQCWMLMLIICLWGNVYFKYVNYLPDNLNSNDIYTCVRRQRRWRLRRCCIERGNGRRTKPRVLITHVYFEWLTIVYSFERCVTTMNMMLLRPRRSMLLLPLLLEIQYVFQAVQNHLDGFMVLWREWITQIEQQMFVKKGKKKKTEKKRATISHEIGKFMRFWECIKKSISWQNSLMNAAHRTNHSHAKCCLCTVFSALFTLIHSHTLNAKDEREKKSILFLKKKTKICLFCYVIFIGMFLLMSRLTPRLRYFSLLSLSLSAKPNNFQ